MSKSKHKNKARPVAPGHVLYFAYGANTNADSMARRCPAARAVATCTIPDHALVFRGVADVVVRKGFTVRGVMWEITAECERALDAFEGFPRLYVKKYVDIRWAGRDHKLMLYVMRVQSEQSPPWEYYEQTLREGYTEFGVTTKQIDRAIAEAARCAGKRKREVKAVRAGSQWIPAKPTFQLKYAPDERDEDEADVIREDDLDANWWPDNIAPWRRGAK